MPVVTPPPTWPHPSVGGSYFPPNSPSWAESADPAVIDNLKRQIDQLKSQLANSFEENIELKSQVLSGSDSVHDVEGILIPSQVANTNSSNTDRRAE
jgi:hypothetical protein